MTGDRDRLAHALAAAKRVQESGPLKALPMQLRTLGLGQVASMLLQQDKAGITDPLLRWAGRVHAFRATGPGPFLSEWCSVTDPAVIRSVEGAVVAWAVDVRLMRELIDVQDGPRPTTALPWANRAGQAVDVARGIAADHAGLVQTLHNLPYALTTDGLVRTLGWLARSKEKDHHPLVRIIHDRVQAIPTLTIPQGLGAFVDWIVDRANQDAAVAAEAEALMWVVSLKQYARAFEEAAA
ncbi:MAG: hypothetical protein IT332_14305 [Ardenticatenales bacterium]|nr:hypothetical protein [Ardenticatenales bacterium]